MLRRRSMHNTYTKAPDDVAGNEVEHHGPQEKGERYSETTDTYLM